jgi:RNA-directed DNA polymerase
VLDFYAERWQRREAAGAVMIVRYTKDSIIGFEHDTDARRFGPAARGKQSVSAIAPP